jgi:GNAT superfamily N-acetyltransferase
VETRTLKNLIKLLVEQEFQTKLGNPIEFKIYERSPDSDRMDRGWALHKIEAYVGGKEAGYIKISYIPRANFEKEYASIIQYVDKITGTGFGIPKIYRRGGEYVSDYFDQLPLEVQVKALDVEWPYYFDRNKKPEEHTEKELLNLKRKFFERIEKKYGAQFRDFESYMVDKPIVDYINVEKPFQRQRIGAALYEYAARWLAKKGYKLYASGLQTPKAKASWQWMKKDKGSQIGSEKDMWYGDEKKRTYLSYVE